MTNLTIKGHKVQLNNNVLTGDTYPIKLFVKEYLNGKWDAANKAWIVDLGQVEKFMGVQINADAAPAAQATSKRTTSNNGWCNKCQSWCYGDCDAN